VRLRKLSPAEKVYKYLQRKEQQQPKTTGGGRTTTKQPKK
jgi:hypothetical protein